MPGMAVGQVAYVAEAYYNNPQFTWAFAPTGTPTGIYVEGLHILMQKISAGHGIVTVEKRQPERRGARARRSLLSGSHSNDGPGD